MRIGRIDTEQLGQALEKIASDFGAAPGKNDPSDADSIAEGLFSFGDATVVAELIDLFLQDAPARLAQAREALATGNVVGIVEAAHSLKGSARNLRAERLAQACETLEQVGKSEKIYAAARPLGQAEAELKKITTLLKQQKELLGQTS